MALRATAEPSRPGSDSPPSKPCFSTLFERTCARQGDRVALVDETTRLTFRAWADASARLATALAERGIGRGDVVAFQLPNWWETAVLFTAIARLGAIANPLLPMLRERELLFMLRQSGAKLLFVPDRYRATNYLELGERVRQLGAPVEAILPVRSPAPNSFADMTRVSGQPPPIRVHPDDLLLLMYTSGTTADPKGVLHSNATLVAEVESLERAHRLSPSDSTLMPSPLTHISGVVHGIMSPAILATTAVLMDRWEPERATEMIAREGITYMVGAPIFLQDLLSASSAVGWAKSLRLFSCGGASVSADLMRRAGERLHCVAKRVYGSTEFPTITTTGPDDVSGAAIETEGKPIAPNEVRIVDPHGNVVAAGEQGEIQARGPECFVGYADPLLNDDSFCDDGWFRTGDLGRIDRDGNLTVTGRIKEIVIRKGEKISIREVEDLLHSHPAIERASVVGIPDPEVGERLCAALEIAPGVEVSAADVTEFLRAQGLATRKLPERIEIVPSLPQTDSGKVHRSAVAALFERARDEEHD